MLGSQAACDSSIMGALALAVEKIGAPCYLGGGSRGLLGRYSRVQYRHNRSEAMKLADVVMIGGVVNDFRMGYGRTISSKAYLISANRSKADLYLNRWPDQAVLADAADFFIRVADAVAAMRLAEDPSASATTGAPEWSVYADWNSERTTREQEHIAKLDEKERAEAWATQSLPEKEAKAEREALVNPVLLARQIEAVAPDNALFVADGGDIVATCAYNLSGRGPLTWLDPGAFGTLGVGFGFALGAALACPDREVWALFGDGAVGFSMMEMDTLARHGVRVIAVVGNDGCWTQIHRDQVQLLKSDVACMLEQHPYELVADSLGGQGLAVGGQFGPAQDSNSTVDNNSAESVNTTLQTARKLYAEKDKPVLVNVHIGKSDFRDGALSM